MVEAKEATPPDCVSEDFKVVAPATVSVLVTFNKPPMSKSFDWISVVPVLVRVDVPLKAPATEFQNGKLFTPIALDVVTVPDPPVLEQVDVVTLPDASTDKQPLAPASDVIESAVVVAWPLIVVEASEAVPPDWAREAFNVVAPPTVSEPLPVRTGPLLVVWRNRVAAPTSIVVDAAPVSDVKAESPIIELEVKVSDASATEKTIPQEKATVATSATN